LEVIKKITILPNFKYRNSSSSSSKLRHSTEGFKNAVFMRLTGRGTPTTREETAGWRRGGSINRQFIGTKPSIVL